MEDNNSNITINIHGGNNQILPNATHAEQNFYSTGSRERIDDFENADENECQEDAENCVGEETSRISLYINKVEKQGIYIGKLKKCTTAYEIAQVAIEMLQDEDIQVDKEEIVKERFIKQLIPLTPKTTKGKTISNVRAHINNALIKLPRQR